MQKTALQRLPVNWQNWIIDNVAQGCDPEGLVRQLQRDGPFDRTLAEFALADALLQRYPGVVVLPRLPDIDTAANKIGLPDRVVYVLLSLTIPRIVLLGNVLGDDECDAIAEMSRNRFVRSTTVDAITGASREHESRTSQSAGIRRAETELVSRIDARLAALANWPVDHAETLQLQKYQVGNEYRPHVDWFDPALSGTARHLADGGQRLGTIILYLSDVDEGGGTSFPELGLDVHPHKGCALFFRNTTPYGLPDQKTLHAGLPVEKGTKIIANKWLREKAH